jgi:prepilin-type N-terminal cleavage/methylation domain-containing protein
MSASSRCTPPPAESPLMPLFHTTRSRRSGFTLLEMIVVITITGALSSIAILAFSTVHGRLGARSAQDNFLSMHAQARAFAVERGTTVRFIMDAVEDRLRIEWTGPDGVEVLNELDLGGEFDVDMTLRSGSTASPGIVCFTPRGLAEPGCGTVTATTRVRFTRGARADGVREVELLPFGQARGL